MPRQKARGKQGRYLPEKGLGRVLSTRLPLPLQEKFDSIIQGREIAQADAIREAVQQWVEAHLREAGLNTP